MRSAAGVAGIRYCAGATSDGGNTSNVVDVGLAPGVPAPDASLERKSAGTPWAPDCCPCESGLTLVGLLRGASMNVYAGEERITPEREGPG